ncbi:LysR family transcriptional regulator [Neogemmobacter tilapiae]|uniref:LysR family transcriptional regulator n=1 Tax=Neogemmobacter tilapiae TaxID=875041 RepID=A0A918TLN3_9RHOB|nr:LysR family transcriptional regulator [Gemmobacter tilapiae]GHC53696.1 LysR family transcriptional regulator [Gemmobacter tilapiae]
MPVSPPIPKLPPLRALRAFESAGRLGSFAAAASELGVTPGAVTALIKGLEADLGAPLFTRQPRGVELTALGAETLAAFTAAFDALGLATRALWSSAAPRAVHIATLPAIAQLWLSPRLPALRSLAPDIAISITAMEAPPNLKRSPHDLCLFFSDGPGQVIASDVIYPVCAPSLAPRLQSPDDLAHVPCLTDSAWDQDWPRWLAAANTRITPRGPIFSLYALALEEALNGAGVLIGHHPLVAPHLESGRLVAPFALRLPVKPPLRLWSARPLEKGHAARRVADRLTGQE